MFFLILSIEEKLPAGRQRLTSDEDRHSKSIVLTQGDQL
jgi:hypothetical protein